MAPQRKSFSAGDLGLVLEQHADGLLLCSLRDLVLGREFLSPNPGPLFTLLLRHTETQQEVSLSADHGWQQVGLESSVEGLTMHWLAALEPAGGLVQVAMVARADHEHHAWRWSLRVELPGSRWSVWRLVFPQLDTQRPGQQALALLPISAGQISADAWDRAVDRRSLYPGGWRWGLQFLAIYSTDPGASTGLYVGHHDPSGSTKELAAVSDPSRHLLRLSFDHPAADMGRAGNGLALQGTVCWQLLRGDWFDAARIYKAWLQSEAPWWPRLAEQGRADTAQWMRELCVWVRGSTVPTGDRPATISETVARLQTLRDFLGIPLGFHWYCWHQIPFDNDYPHYFPALDGFAEGVRRMQESGVRVMPYINARLWDTRDRGLEDWQFTSLALPAATKDEQGQPITETYGSKEADGSPVRLAVMCPTTAFWQDTVKGLVLRLLGEFGVDAVYMDQIAAAEPVLCQDSSHRHPLGGGAWWGAGYRRMLKAIRQAMPAGRALTTECNSEAFASEFDGYLTWHWQQNSMVPVFPAIYGGAIQMFGRSYGDPSTDPSSTLPLAWCMRIGQQLVYGEQIGWMDLNTTEGMPLDFLRQAARLRWQVRRTFYAGEMQRPPRLRGEIPTVRADWQWQSEQDTWVAMDAVVTGAWQVPGENRLLLLFANVSDRPVIATLVFDAREYGIAADRLQVTKLQGPDEPAEQEWWPSSTQCAVTFAPQRALALELAW
jgi:hypothetical protein